MELISIPYFGLIWTGIGFLFMLIGFFRLAYEEHESEDYTGIENSQAQELFAYFLEEEEKKNNALRQTIEEAKVWKEDTQVIDEEEDKEPQKYEQQECTDSKMVENNQSFDINKDKKDEIKLYDEIIKLYESGASVEDIAKKLGKGKGEIQLMLSLYAIR